MKTRKYSKNKKSVLLLLLLLFSLNQVFAAECGDVNSDDTVDIVDALLTAKAYVGTASVSKSVADVNSDNEINIVDALLIAQLYVDIIDQLNCSSIVTETPKSDPTNNTNTAKGIISITDPVPGWASVAGGTTGGGTDLSKAVTVSSMGELKSAANGSDKKIILVKPGTYSGSFEPGANKSIIGIAPGVTIQGRIYISGSNKENIIVRNLAVRGNYCSGDSACKNGDDAVYVGNGAHHVWFDHCDIADGQDGNFDLTKASDYVTISWTKLWYTKKKPHAQCSLVAGSNSETQSRGKLQITFMYCWWSSNIRGRQPRGRFGKIHSFCNYHKSGGNLHGIGREMSMIAENCYYDEPRKAVFFSKGSPTGWKGIGNEGTARLMNDSNGTVFTIPYEYTTIPASQVMDVVTAPVGGAGNTVQLQM